MDIVTLACGLLVIAFALDVILSWSWQSAYFRYGLPLFWQTRHVVTSKQLVDCVPFLEKRLRHDISPVIEFQAIGQNEYAFREKVFSSGGLRYLHIMHGYLHLEPDTQQLTVIGHAKWFVVTALLLVVAGLVVELANGAGNPGQSPLPGSAIVLLPIGMGLLVCYGIQAWRYSNVGKDVRGLLSFDV